MIASTAQTFIDKRSWGDGPWQSEPDTLQWPDPATGLPCLIVRNRQLGNLCGYVGVPPGHPYYGRSDYDDLNVAVHGGLTWAGPCQPDREHGICHVAPPEEADVWWLGFDMAHAGDGMPRMREVMKWMGGTYRDVAYVRGWCALLALQLREAGNGERGEHAADAQLDLAEHHQDHVDHKHDDGDHGAHPGWPG